MTPAGAWQTVLWCLLGIINDWDDWDRYLNDWDLWYKNFIYIFKKMAATNAWIENASLMVIVKENWEDVDYQIIMQSFWQQTGQDASLLVLDVTCRALDCLWSTSQGPTTSPLAGFGTIHLWYHDLRIKFLKFETAFVSTHKTQNSTQNNLWGHLFTFSWNLAFFAANMIEKNRFFSRLFV